MALLGLGFLWGPRVSTDSLRPFVVSAILVSISQFSLSLVPIFCDSSSLFVMLPVSALVLVAVAVIGGVLKRLLRVSASAPALVFLNIFFVFGVYTVFIRQEVSLLVNAALYAESALLVFGLYSILRGDPGYVAYGSVLLSNDQDSLTESGYTTEIRVRYCKKCKKHIKGFDHHCPAFGNCIGLKNHRLFILLLIGFILSEISFIKFSSQSVSEVYAVPKSRLEMDISRNLVISTMLFSILQVLWQVIFLMWHVYCICFNIKTDEWINWTTYPEFHRTLQSQSGQFPQMEFQNPYDKGILLNILDFLKGCS
ncbi:uncharacterized protein LOC116254125 isoform X2 [Nymphaea colorata]|uniref:uncharacterized protein LOC116254125 isoform X2 n=1 Tax=Nymphaea colorata TaxID=210225 RepID=UPI00214F39DD|nr:uncharacterized protein LOC116254125 isoform X2 [Nymphaea colorata]